MLAPMRQRLKHWSVAAVLVLATSASLVACGDEGGTKGDSSGVGTTGTSLTKENFFTEITKAQVKASTAHVTMDLKTRGQSVTSDGDIKLGDSAGETAMAMKIETGQKGMGALDLRLVDNVFYLNIGPMTQNKFARIDLADRTNPISRQYRDLIDSIDPVKQLEQFEGAVTSFEKTGDPVELDNVQAQPYTVVVDPSKIERLKSSGAPLPKKLTYTVYVGPDNLPRRLVSKRPDTGGSGPSSLTMDYSKWGENITIDAPPKSQITDKDMLRKMLGNQQQSAPQ
jgi:hypothetical protein